MKTMQITICCVAFTVAALTIACAKPPTDKMNDATEAVLRAENDMNAVIYASNAIARAQDALARMQAEADSKRYDTASSYADEAIAAAERAINEGRAGATRARDEASSIVSQLPPLITETGQGINAARATGLPLDYDSIDHDFDIARIGANEAQTALSGGRYQDAIEQGRTVRTRLSNINQQLSNVVVATTRMK
jgi:hypothetical protein